MIPAAALPGKPLRKRVMARPLAALVRLQRRYGVATLVLGAAIAIPLVANAVLLAGYLNASNQRAVLTRQLQEGQQSIDERQKALAVAPKVTAVPGGPVGVPKNVESADMMDTFLRLSQDSAVDLVAVDDGGVSTQRIDNRDYRAFKFTLQVRARSSQLGAFLSRLEQVPPNSFTVSNLSATPSGDQQWKVTIDVVAYAQK